MWRRILWWWRRDTEEQDLDDEIRAHIAIEARQQSESGRKQEDAEVEARRLFGNRARIAEETRDVWRIVWLEQFWQDVQYGLRSLRRTPALTLAVIATFALGIGANTALFSVIYTVLLKPLPYQDPERLVWITEDTLLAPLRGSGRQRHFTNMLVTSDLLEWKNGQVFDAISSFSIVEETITMNDAAWYPRVARSSEPLGKIPGVLPALGRDFTSGELEPGAAGVALLSDSMYRQRFGSDPSLIGKSLTIGGDPYTVIGVMPATFRLPWPADGQTQFEAEVIVNAPIRPTNPYLEGAVARLKAGETIEAAHAQLAAIAKGNDEQDKTSSEVIGREVRIEPLHERIVGAVRSRLLVLWAAVGFVLLIACVNVTNLLLSRAAARAREVAIRTALGAGQMRLIRQQLTESVALALAGGMTGAGLAALGIRILAGSAPSEIPRLRDAAVDGNALAFTFAVCAITGGVSGLASALSASATRPVQVLTTGAPTGSPWRRRLHGALVVSELALAMVLTAGAGLMVKSLWRMDAGMADSEQVFTARVELAGNSLARGERDVRLAQIQARWRYVADTVEQIEALPGVTAAAFWLTGFSAVPSFGPRGIARIDGREPQDVPLIPATSHYFTVAGMRLLAGRFFTEEDGNGAGRPLIVNEAFLRPYGLSPASAVGMYLGYADEMGAPENPARTLRSEHRHYYSIRTVWTGNLGQGTKTYSGYSRNHEWSGAEKYAAILGSSDPGFRGDRTRYNPEELLVMSLSSCHMLWMLHLLADAGIVITEYSDEASGTMMTHPDGAGEFVEVTLRPLMKLEDPRRTEEALKLHEKAHEKCFIARSVKFRVGIEPRVEHA